MNILPYVENSMEVPPNTKNIFTIWSSNPTPGHIPRQNYNLKRQKHSYVHCSVINNNQDMEAPKCPSTDKWIKKMRYVYTMEYYSVIKKAQNNAICSNMDYHTTWSKSERKRQILYGIASTCNLKYGMNQSIHEPEIDSQT